MSTARESRSRASGSAEVELDLKALFGAVAKHRLWIAIPTLAAFFLSFAYVNMVTPRYASEARIFVENRETPLTRQGGDRQQVPEQLLDQEAIASQVQIIYSRDVARAVIRDLDLTKLPEFDPMIEGRSLPTYLLALFGIVRDIAQMTAEERALEAYYERLSVYPVDRSRVIEVRFMSKNSELAARVANAIAERYIDAQTRAKLERDRRARQHFQRTIDELRQQVAAAESRVQEHRARFDLLTGTTNQTLGVQTVSELNTQLSTAQAQRADAQARANAIRELLRSGRPIEASDVFNSPVIQRLSDQRAQLRAELAQQSTILLPGHPRMRELNAQVADNEAQYRVQAERIARGLENDARFAGERVNTLRRALDEQKRATSAQGDQEVALRGLEREARAQRELLESWLGMYRESSARDSLDVRAADARIVSAAAPATTPAWPRKLPIVLVATLSAVLVAILLLITRELVSGRAFIDRGALAVLRPVEPWLSLAADGDATKAPAAEPLALRLAAASLVSKLTEEAGARPLHRVVVTGAVAAAGATSLAIAFARGLADAGKKVVLVDAQFARPGIADVAGLKEEKGLSDLLLGEAGFADIVHRDPTSRVHIVPAGQRSADAGTAVLEGPKVATVLAALDTAYDIVVLDVASIIESDATGPLAAKADLVVMVAGEGTLPDVAAAARSALELSGAKRVETVMVNGAAERRQEAPPAPMSELKAA